MGKFERYPLKKLFQLDEERNKKLEEEAKKKKTSQAAIIRKLIDTLGG